MENIDENKTEFEIGGTPVKVVEVGSTGTDISSGYLFEEYLQDLQGRQAADIFDKMRRSDPKVKMILSAMKNPIKGAAWEINEKGDETREGEIQKAFIEHILFNDLGKTWKSFLHEALSCIDFGYSLFEITYSAVLNHEVFGSYNGIKSLAFRSQRTIEKWNINRGGKLESVEQEAFGDHQKNVTMPAKYLLHFALEKEGDNFEGISILRPAYGPWLRKNTFLKLIAAGIEKYAIPIPILTIPEGKQGSQEYKDAKEAMRKYVSHQCNYLTVPHGWELKLNNNPFDASKIRDVINDENVEIVNAALANFLELGQSGSGSYALSFDLSDFFLGGLEYVAEQIAETINLVLIPNLISLNFPGQKPMVELNASGISDRAGEELSKVILNLVNAGAIKPDDRLEDNLRKRYNLPEADESTTREPEETPTVRDDKTIGGGAQQFAEKKEPSKKKSSDPVKRKIESGAESLKEIMKTNLDSISNQVVNQAVNHRNDANKLNRLRPPKQYKLVGVKKYRDAMVEELARQYNAAVNQAKNQNKRYSNIKLSETALRIQLAEKDKLSKKALIRINGIVDSLVDVNVADITKSVDLQYTQSNEKLDSDKEFKQKLQDTADKKVDGPMTSAGSLVNAATILNAGRKDLFTEIMKTGEVESFTWVNPDPVTDICKGLNGVTLPVDHPDVDRYWPPLHFNCKTYTVANTANHKNNPETQNGFTPTKTQTASINLAEPGQANCPDDC